ncbi:MAG: Calx-beta domain-containing protein, partial [Bacteroidota bacterium]
MKNFFLTSIAILLSLLSFGQGTEDFANCGTASSYGTRSWNGTTASWTATDARADQTINGKAITVRNGSLTSTSTITGGIKKLTVSTQLKFSGSSGTFDLEINGNVVSTIAYSASVQTIIVDNIDISGNVVISFTNNSSSSNRVAFDDLSWTAYTAPTGPVITLTSSNVASEAAGTVITLTATADQLLSANGTIDLDISGTGITLTDYSLSNTTITIPSGSSIGTATLTILDDSDVEGTETLIATILNPSTGLFIGTPNNQAITITDNDFNPDVNLSADLSAGTEVGQTVITLTATATYAVTGNQTVDLVVTGTGITGTDFVLSSSQITILNGQTTGTATFTIADDSDLEGPETATIAISNPSTGITIVSPTSVTVDIADDDLIIYDLIINEVLADPASGADVNNDGNASTSEDEFIEIYNNENNSIDLSGYT